MQLPMHCANRYARYARVCLYILSINLAFPRNDIHISSALFPKKDISRQSPPERRYRIFAPHQPVLWQQKAERSKVSMSTTMHWVTQHRLFRGSSLNYLSDLFIMGGALILETNVLLRWAKKEGFGPLAVHGISMGGHVSGLSLLAY